ncbi:MAG: FtsX-like permease family protein, partial [Candidatus Zixiibacteriota bacterium]
DKDLGFDTDRMVVVPLVRNLNGEDFVAIRSELLRQRGVRAVSASSTLPCDDDVRGITVRTTDGREIGMPIVYADHDYVETVGLKLLTGRSFSHEHATDDGRAFMINESAARALSEDFAVGSRLFAYAGRAQNMAFKYDGAVIGVVEDYHFRDLFNTRHNPVVLVVDLSRTKYLLVRIDGQNIPATLASIKDVYSGFAPDQPVELSFLDSHIENLYRREKRFSTIFGYACLLAILVALVGLFGLAARLTQQRTKEIGIRKVLGASVGNIVTLLGNEFARLVIVANLVAAPIAWYFLHGWLNNYPYRISLAPVFFAAAAALTLVLALLAVGYQSFKSATADPVDALRHE